MAALERRLHALEKIARQQPGAVGHHMSDAQLMQIAFRAILQGVQGVDPLPARVRALLERMDNGIPTDADLQLIADLPDCSLPAHELVRLLVETRKKF